MQSSAHPPTLMAAILNNDFTAYAFDVDLKPMDLGNTVPKLQAGNLRGDVVVGPTKPAGFDGTHVTLPRIDQEVLGTCIQIRRLPGDVYGERILCETLWSGIPGLKAVHLDPRTDQSNYNSITEPSLATHTIREIKSPGRVMIEMGSIILIVSDVAVSKKKRMSKVVMAIVIAPTIPAEDYEKLHYMHSLLSMTHNSLIKLWDVVYDVKWSIIERTDYSKIKIELKTMHGVGNKVSFFNTKLFFPPSAAPIADGAGAGPVVKRVLEGGEDEENAAAAAKKACNP